jgi:hypothetical protein
VVILARGILLLREPDIRSIIRALFQGNSPPQSTGTEKPEADVACGG